MALLLIHSIRLTGWYHAKIWTKPLLWWLYLAYGFLILDFGFKGLSYYFVTLPLNLDVHSFTLSIGLITIGMMSRVSLGHTGNDVFNPPKKTQFNFRIIDIIFCA